VSPLPQAPPGVLGVVNVAGQRIPVFTLRQRLRLPTRALDPNNRFVVTRTAQCPLICVMDAVVEVRNYEPEKEIVPGPIVSKGKNYAGLKSLADGLIVVHNIDSLFSVEEEQLLLSALATA
jgi:purine-binding chemotaxis protein CheW